MNMLVKIVFVALLFVAVIPYTPLASQDMAVPAALQATVFKQVFTVNKMLAEKKDMKVIVAYQSGATKAVAEQMAREFEKTGIAAQAMDVKDLAATTQIDVLYLMPGVAFIGDLTEQRRIVSITGVPSFVENGKASIGVVALDGKPKLMVNLWRLKSEGQKISASLLKLAKIID